MLVGSGAVPGTYRLAGTPAGVGLCPTARDGAKSVRSRAQAAAPAPLFRRGPPSAKPGSSLGRRRHGPAAGALSAARQRRLSLVGLGDLKRGLALDPDFLDARALDRLDPQLGVAKLERGADLGGRTQLIQN